MRVQREYSSTAWQHSTRHPTFRANLKLSVHAATLIHPSKKTINKTITSEHPRSLGLINTLKMRFLLSKSRILSQVRRPSYLLPEEPGEARQKKRKKTESLTQVPDSHSPIRANLHKFLQVLLQTTATPLALGFYPQGHRGRLVDCAGCPLYEGNSRIPAVRVLARFHPDSRIAGGRPEEICGFQCFG